MSPLKHQQFVTDAKWANADRVSCVCLAPFSNPVPEFPAKVVVLDAEDPRVVAFLKKHTSTAK